MYNHRLKSGQHRWFFQANLKFKFWIDLGKFVLVIPVGASSSAGMIKSTWLVEYILPLILSFGSVSLAKLVDFY